MNCGCTPPPPPNNNLEESLGANIISKRPHGRVPSPPEKAKKDCCKKTAEKKPCPRELPCVGPEGTTPFLWNVIRKLTSALRGGLLVVKDCHLYFWKPECKGHVMYDGKEFHVDPAPDKISAKSSGDDYVERGYLPLLEHKTIECGCESTNVWEMGVQEIAVVDSGEPAILDVDCETGLARIDQLKPSRIEDASDTECLRQNIFKEEEVDTDCGIEVKKTWYSAPAAIHEFGDIKTSMNPDASRNGWKLAQGGSLDAAQYPWLEGILCKVGDFYQIPDMRGLFLRGVDAGANVDKDASSREAQFDGCSGGDNAGTVQDQSQFKTAMKFTDKDTYVDTWNTYEIQTEDSTVVRIGTGAWEAVAAANGVPGGDPHEDYIFSVTLTETRNTEEVDRSVAKEIISETPTDFECEEECEIEEVPFGCEVRPKNISVHYYIYVGCPECK